MEELLINKFTRKEFQNVMTFIGLTVLIMTGYNLYLTIKINHNKIKEIENGY